MTQSIAAQPDLGAIHASRYRDLETGEAANTANGSLSFDLPAYGHRIFSVAEGASGPARPNSLTEKTK